MHDLEFAEKEFQRFCDEMDIATDPASMPTQEDKDSFNKLKHVVVTAISKKKLIIDDHGQPVYTTCDEQKITFYEPTGASSMAMDNKGKNADVAKMYAAMQDMTKTERGTFARMPRRDLKVCEAIAVLFMA